ncbi:MAG: tRNA (adenosine(37)-N6)-threonylcarbamoyltransferase complex ATPase subunit type 1 TsaE [Bacteroidota bacterium]
MYIEYSLDQVDEAAQEVLKALDNQPQIICLDGELGAGKTTLVSALCRAWGIADPATSPTYGIVNEYQSPDGPVYHLDCYRLESLQEALDLGVEEYLDSKGWILIEWAGILNSLLPRGVCILRLSLSFDGSARRLLLERGS